MNQSALECLHCSGEMPPFVKPRLYCSLACEQEAELIRYVRRCTLDGRIEQPDVQEAVKIRLAHIMSGGYDKKSREISCEVRVKVLQRSKGKCEQCGKDGRDIDHIEGSIGDLSNLQLLCKDCHNQKTQLSITPVEPGTEQFEYVKARTESFWRFVQSEKPVRVCHDHENWKSCWRQYQKERKAFTLALS
ncbi:HNH endonuclease [Microbulbifer sp. ZKSA006]|uniref:HNH endonuclease n=1 Tax=Microbulbifer sp. ZKSA006 TaxID=3243390 RepID=UPI00403A354D